MAYCTTADILGEYVIFPQTGTTRFTETSALIALKIPRAEATINSYVGRRYTIPFTDVPPRIEGLAINLTAYYALQSKFTRDSHNTNDWVEKVGKEAIADLELIRDRKIDLVDTAGSVLTERMASTRVVSSTQDYQPFADLDEATEWAVPTDRIDAIDR